MQVKHQVGEVMLLAGEVLVLEFLVIHLGHHYLFVHLLPRLKARHLINFQSQFHLLVLGQVLLHLFQSLFVFALFNFVGKIPTSVAGYWLPCIRD